MKKMELISLRLSREETEMIDTLLRKGYAASRSDLIRQALKEFYKRRLGSDI